MSVCTRPSDGGAPQSNVLFSVSSACHPETVLVPGKPVGPAREWDVLALGSAWLLPTRPLWHLALLGRGGAGRRGNDLSEFLRAVRPLRAPLAPLAPLSCFLLCAPVIMVRVLSSHWAACSSRGVILPNKD